MKVNLKIGFFALLTILSLTPAHERKPSNGLQWTWDKSAKQWTGPDQIKE
jgi:hypothetical protein